jgi:predicted porin
MKHTPIAIACAALVACPGSAWAAGQDDVEQLKQQMNALQQQVTTLQGKLNAVTTAPASTEAAQEARAATAPPADSTGGLTAQIGGANVSLYGFADVSADWTFDGKEHVSQVSSNLSYFGVRGNRALGSSGLKAIVQFETLVNVSGTPTETSGLGSRNSFVGLEGEFGKVMLGKYDTPYKRSTAIMDPFQSSVGDYNTIMGNTGGDLRTEFDARLPHSIFYDSRKYQGVTVNALYSPGQKYNNLANADNYAFPQGERVCSGGSPGGSGSLPDPITHSCNDGAFKNAWSLAATYERGPLLVTISYERHQSVDRTGDNGGNTTDEGAAKIGALYNFPTPLGANRLSVIYEKFFRSGIDDPFNERARDGFYLSDVQELGNGIDVMAAWAHAGQTPGGPDFGTVNDRANMYVVGAKYHFDKQVAFYLAGALLRQGRGAHYALGAGGHGTPIASPRDDNGNTIPGQQLWALSAGLQYSF